MNEPELQMPPEENGAGEQQPKQKEPWTKKRIMKEVIDWALTIIVPVVLALLLHNFVFTFSIVNQTSMTDTLQPNDWLAVSKISLRLGDPQRCQIVMCTYENEGDKLFVKRVIGLPGETIQIVDGQVHINGVPLVEDYIAYPLTETTHPLTLGPDEYFVMGDNRYVSWDSRAEGPIRRESLYGLVLGKVFPFGQMKWLA